VCEKLGEKKFLAMKFCGENLFFGVFSLGHGWSQWSGLFERASSITPTTHHPLSTYI
jgi:hypothetical protein